MKIVFPVLWRKMWRSLTIYISVVSSISLSFMLVIGVWRFGYERTFRHVTPLGVLMFMFGVLALAIVFSLIGSLLFRRMKVTLDDDFIQGRNFWGVKRKIPLDKITAIHPFNSQGIQAVVVSSARHGEIYISIHTENLAELLMLIGTYLPKEKCPPDKDSLQGQVHNDV